jgi:hypothetical protein
MLPYYASWAEIIICLCNGGSQPKRFQVPAEDEILAQNIPGIDIIAAGHTHYGYKAKRVVKKMSLITDEKPKNGQIRLTNFWPKILNYRR